MIKYIVGTAVAMIVWMALSYYERGYYAMGAEFMFPMIAYFLYQLDEEESR